MMGTAFWAIILLLFPVVVGVIAYYEGYKNGRIDAHMEILKMNRILYGNEKREGGEAE